MSYCVLSYCQTCVPMSCVSLPLVPIFGFSCSCPHSVNLVPAVSDLFPGVSRFPLVSSVYLYCVLPLVSCPLLYVMCSMCDSCLPHAGWIKIVLVNSPVSPNSLFLAPHSASRDRTADQTKSKRRPFSPFVFGFSISFLFSLFSPAAMEVAVHFIALARRDLPFVEYWWKFCGLAAVMAFDDATNLSLFWHGANYHRPVDLPDTTGLGWREGILRCPPFAAPSSPPPSVALSSPPSVRKSTPPSATPSSPPPSAALSNPPSAGKSRSLPAAADSSPPATALSSPEHAPVPAPRQRPPEPAPQQPRARLSTVPSRAPSSARFSRAPGRIQPLLSPRIFWGGSMAPAIEAGAGGAGAGASEAVPPGLPESLDPPWAPEPPDPPRPPELPDPPWRPPEHPPPPPLRWMFREGGVTVRPVSLCLVFPSLLCPYLFFPVPVPIQFI